MCEAVRRFSLVLCVAYFLFYFPSRVLARGCALLTFKRKKNKAMQKRDLMPCENRLQGLWCQV